MLLARSSYFPSSGIISKPIKLRRGKKSFNELSKGYQFRIITAELINQSSIEMVYYSWCLNKTLYYIIDRTYSNKCLKYLRFSQPYDIVSLSTEGIRRLLNDKSTLKTNLSTVKARFEARFQAL